MGQFRGKRAFYGVCLSLLSFALGCGSSVQTVSSPPTVTINVAPNAVVSGATAVLTVAASNATGVSISGTDGSKYAMAAGGGTQQVTPAVTTTYTASAQGANTTATATATLTVTAAPLSPTVSLTANPTTIAAGSTSTLTAVSTNATQVVVAGSDGSNYTLSSAGGSQVVTPKSSTSYTATATGAGGKATATTTVTVAAVPSITITANPATIASGSSSTLSVTAANATQVVVTGTDGTSYTLGATGGSQLVAPTASTTYTAKAVGLGGQASATTTVTVAAVPTVTITASPAAISSGASSVLTVSAANASTVTVTGTDSTSYSLSATGGSQSVAPKVSTTYTATAVGVGGQATASTTVTVAVSPTVSISAAPASISAGGSSVLTVTAANSATVTVSGSDGSSSSLSATGGTLTVSPASTATYTAVATGPGGSASSATTVTVTAAGSIQSINHVILMLQENHTFDNYFGMLNPYRAANGWTKGDDGKTYSVDGIDDKLATTSNDNDEGSSFKLFKFKSTCVDDLTSSWLESYGDVSRYDFSTSRGINIDGFVHTAENYAKNCAASNGKLCSGSFTDMTGQRSMGYYDSGFLNYYYYMASQFAVSDRWFSPVSSKSIPNRIATFTGGTTQGLVFDPGNDDHLTQLNLPNIFQELDSAKVSWKIYYTVTQGACLDQVDCQGGAAASYPATNFGYLSYSYQYLHENPSGAACVAPSQPSSVVGDTSNSFCIDPTHIAPLSTYYSDLTNGTLPSFAFIEPGYGVNDEHPGSGQSILSGQQQVSKVIGSLIQSPSWKDSVFFLAYDEGGGPYDHVPPTPNHSNDYTDPTVGSASVASIPDIKSISVNADTYNPCVSNTGSPTLHCDLGTLDPGAQTTDAPAVNGFAAQLGFRVPNLVISPFTRKHYISHIPMDHTSILRFVENRFIGPNTYLTKRDAAQPDLLDFFDFSGVPWSIPPTPPDPITPTSLGYDPCTPQTFAP